MQFNCAYTELVNINKLVPNPKNPNKHPQEQIKRLAKIIEFQGQRSAIVVSKRSGFITKGHGRLEALRSLGYTEVAVDYQDYLSEAQEYADIIADNEIARWAELDRFMLFEDMKDLDLGDFELLGTEKDIFKNLAESELEIEDVGDIETEYSFQIKCTSKIEFEKLKSFFNTGAKQITFSEIEHRLI